MKRPAEYYTLWNQAVEAVEIYLARNPRELTEDQILDAVRMVARLGTQMKNGLDPRGTTVTLILARYFFNNNL